MILSPTYSRVAVRPFPLTEGMKEIIQESTDELRRVIDDIMDGYQRGRRFVIWQGDDLPVHNRLVSLSITLVIDGNGKSFEGLFGISRGGYAVIALICSGQMIWDAAFSPGGFYRDFQMVLNHELIHMMDIKNWSSDIGKKLPQYQQPTDKKSYEKYVKHPTEKSAFEGSSYYYFHEAASNGISLKESVDSFLKGDFQKIYRSIIKEGGQRGWKEFLTRIYKSAKQAYQDVAQEEI